MKPKSKFTLFFLGLISYAPQIEIILNKVGPMVHSKGRSGAVIRARVIPTNPRSAGQLVQRGLLSSFTKAWSSLDLVKQEAWIGAAMSYIKKSKLGKAYYSTGHKLFVKWNINAYDNGAIQQISDVFAPTATPVVEISVFNFDTTVNPTVAEFTTDSDTAANSVCQVWATPQLSNGVFNPGKKFRLIKLIPGGTTAGIFNIKTEYESKFGTLQPNKKVWVRLVTFNNDSHKCCVAMGSSELVGSIKG